MQRAAQTGNAPAAWAAYVEALGVGGKVSHRLGSAGFDPEDQEAITAWREWLAGPTGPEPPSADEGAELLAALRGWQRSDPDNALPSALEMLCLYGLYRDDEALVRWQAAAHPRHVRTEYGPQVYSLADLLMRMGLPPADALTTAIGTLSPLALLANVRTCARIALYEGRIAQMEGRAQDAIRWWNATIDLGRHMQDTGDALAVFLVGVPIQGIGANPAWQWYSAEETGLPGGLRRGESHAHIMPPRTVHLLYGEHHDFYVDNVGKVADAELRDSLLVSAARSELLQKYHQLDGILMQYSQATRLIAVGRLVAVFGVVLLLCFGFLSLTAPRVADEATDLRGIWQVLAAVASVIPPAAAAVSLAGMRGDLCVGGLEVGARALLYPLTISGLLVALLPLALALGSRRAGARLISAWRGNLRGILPVAIALSALVCLGLHVTAAGIRARWVQEWHTPAMNEMAHVVEVLGNEWTHPAIPPDAWRAEYPPERGRGD